MINNIAADNNEVSAPNIELANVQTSSCESAKEQLHANIRHVSISEIIVPQTSQEFNKIPGLAESIEMLGLINPITVTTKNRLVAGRHRLEACKELAWKIIPAMVIDLDECEAEIASIDENLLRHELTVLDRSELLARRKVLYEKKHPDANAGIRRAVGMHRAVGNNVGEIKSQTFATDTAAKAKVDKRTVQHELQIATNIAPEVKDLIRYTPLANSKTKLLGLSKLSPDEQAERLLAGADKSVGPVMKSVTAKEAKAKTHYVPEDQLDEIVEVLKTFCIDKADEPTIEATKSPALSASVLLLWSSEPDVRDISGCRRLEQFYKLADKRFPGSKFEFFAPATTVSEGEDLASSPSINQEVAG